MDRGGALPGGGRRGRYRRAAAWLLVITAVLVTEVAVLGDRISADLARLSGSAPGATANVPATPRTPTAPTEPGASGPVSGVDLRSSDACVPGTTCPVRLQVRLTGPGVTDVTWRARTEDLCTGVRHESGERRLRVPRGDRVDVVTDVAVPPGAAVAVTPVVTAPAVAAGPPIVVPARPRCPAAGPGR